MDISDRLSYEEKAIQFLWHKNIELEDKLNQSSNNSSVPPSKNKPQHQHQTKKKNSHKFQGAQPGHKGSRMLHPHDENMTVKMHKPESTCHCGGTVICHKKAHQRFQIFDLPELNYTVTEHQAYQGECNHCDEKYDASLPDTISQTQMGTNLLSFIVIQSADLIHADEISYQRNAEKRWMWVALSKVFAFFQSNYFRNKDAAIKLFGEKLDGVLIID